jgi:hypothetical protein
MLTQAGLFSAVTSAFLIDAQKNLQQDYTQLSAALLQILVYKINNSSFSSADFPLPTWNGPSPTMVNVQCLLYTSLAASLLAAFGAMLGKQWLNRYSRVDNHGSLMDRCRHRQQKYEGMMKWHFDWLMESLPLMLQAALLLLGIALSLYLWTIFTRVGAIMVFCTSLGVLFYVTIIVCGTLWYNCPFQTPTSILVHALIEYDAEYSKYIPAMSKMLRLATAAFFSMISAVAGRIKCRRHEDVEAADPNGEVQDHVERQNDPKLLFTDEEDIKWKEHIADAACFFWISETSTDADVMIATTRFIPEIEWHSGITTTPSLDKLLHDYNSCFDPTRQSDQLIAETREKVCVTSKAIVHLYAQKRYVDDVSLPDIPWCQLRQNNSILGVEMHYTFFVFWSLQTKGSFFFNKRRTDVSVQHWNWMAHILVFMLQWDKSSRANSCVNHFVREVFESNPSRSLLTDCFLMIGLNVDLPVHINDLIVIDKTCVYPFS